MKKLVSNCVLALAAVLFTGAAFGAGTGITVHVPFDFVAGTAKLPAGNYYVSQDDSSVVFITNLQTRTSFAMMPEASVSSGFSAQPGVSFVKVDGNYIMKVVRVESGRGFQMRTAR
jgi:hypothetical protein